MTLQRIDVDEAKRRIDEDGWTYLDVRSRPEFAEEHAAGAYNIPFLHKTPQGMIPNQDFARVVQDTFPDKSSKIIAACQMGGRSQRAARELQSLGYTNVVDLKGGFGSERDDDNNVVNIGWKESGLAVESGEPAGRSYATLSGETPPEPEPAPKPEAPAEASEEAAVDPNFNRFASEKRKVDCFKYGPNQPGLKRRPLPGELGQRIFDTVSARAWDEWVEHSKMIINEYRIHAADPDAVRLLMEQCEQFLFSGGGVARPEGYVPEGAEGAGG